MALGALSSGDPHYPLFHRILGCHPPFQPALEGSHALESQLFHLQRHPGAGLFAGSSTHQHELAFERELLRPALDIFRQYVDGARDAAGIMQHIERMAQIDHQRFVV